jgi:putative ABC transport system permease protein
MESAAYSFGIAPLEDGQAARWMRSGLYLWAPQARNALGVSLLHGNGFTPDDHVDYSFFSAATPPAVAMVTAALARELFGDEAAAVGRQLRLRLPGEPVVTVAGVVADLAGPALHFRPDDLFHVILPVRYARSGPYVVRSVTGRSRMVHDSARAALQAANPARVITHGESFAATEQRYFRSDREMMWLFGILVAALGVLVITGIVSVTHYWVVQRVRAMGFLHTPGRTRRAMFVRFATENAVLMACGAGLGLAGAAAANLALARYFDGRVIPISWYPVAFAGFLVAGQAAVAVVVWRFGRRA